MNLKARIAAKLKEKGIADVGEEVAKVVVESVFEASEEHIKESPSKLDDLGLPLLALVKKFVMKKVDAIDGEEG